MCQLSCIDAHHFILYEISNKHFIGETHNSTVATVNVLWRLWEWGGSSCFVWPLSIAWMRFISKKWTLTVTMVELQGLFSTLFGVHRHRRRLT